MRSGMRMSRGRKLKAKDSNASQLSFSVAGGKKDTGENEVVIMSKKVVEKLSFLVTQHREFVEKSQKQLYLMSNSNKEDKLCELYELLQVHKVLMNRSQSGLYDSNFLIHFGELTDALENHRTKIRSEAKRFSVENRDLKTKLTYLINRLIEMEGNLAKTKEEMQHWETLSKIRLLDGEEETDKLESEVWELVIHPDNKDPLMPPELLKVQDMINEGKVSDAVKVVKQYAQSKKGKKSVDEAGVLCLLAKRCSEEDNSITAVEIIDLAVASRKETLESNHPNIAFTLSAKAIIFGKAKKQGLASQCAFKALQVMESFYKTDKSNRNLGRQYMISGYFLAKWGFPEDGIKLMELALLTFESLLPAEEVAWMDTIVKMAKTCNDCKFHDDTMTVCSELIDYFHEKIYGPISKKNPPIYEVAVDCQRADSATAKLIALNGPKPTYLPPLVAASLREIIIAYSSRYEFGSARIVENYLTECLKLDDLDIINSPLNDGESGKDTKQNLISRRLARQSIFTTKKGIINMKETKVNPKTIEDKINKAAK